MESLEELVKFIGPKFLRQTAILDSKSQETKLSRLYQSIKSAKIKDEDELAESLFGIASSSTVFRQLKSQLKTRLINNLFLIEPNEAQFKSYSNAFQNCRKLFFAAEILYTQGARKISISLAEKVFRMSEKFQFTLMAEMSSFFLRNGYRILGNNQKLKYYRNQSEIYYQKAALQKEIRFIRETLIDDFSYKKSISKDDLDFLNIQESKLTKLLAKDLSPFSMVYGTFYLLSFLL